MHGRQHQEIELEEQLYSKEQKAIELKKIEIQMRATEKLFAYIQEG